MSLKKETGVLELFYTVLNEKIHQAIQLKLVHWNMNYWRMVCPLINNNKACRSLNKNLYAGPSYYFGCAKCQHLRSPQINVQVKKIDSINKALAFSRTPYDRASALLQLMKLFKSTNNALAAKNETTLFKRARMLSKAYGFQVRKITPALIALVREKYPVAARQDSALQP